MSFKAVIAIAVSAVALLGALSLLGYTMKISSYITQYTEGDITSQEYLEKTMDETIKQITPTEVTIIQFFGAGIVGIIILIAYVYLTK